MNVQQCAWCRLAWLLGHGADPSLARQWASLWHGRIAPLLGTRAPHGMTRAHAAVIAALMVTLQPCCDDDDEARVRWRCAVRATDADTILAHVRDMHPFGLCVPPPPPRRAPAPPPQNDASAPCQCCVQ